MILIASKSGRKSEVKFQQPAYKTLPFQIPCLKTY